MNDKRLEITIGNLLRAGVLLAAGVVLGGGIWLLLDSGGMRANYGQFLPPPNALRSPSAIIAGLVAHPSPALIIQFGLLLLIATPVARVVVSLVAFAIERDRMYVVLTAIVLAILSYSLAIPH
jgi:uncharacterized membrane protein